MNRWNLPEQTFFTVKELTSILKCGRNKIYKLINSGKLKSVKEGRQRKILFPQLVEYLEGLETPPAII
jgi:excisionase family DNA binding protein